MEYVCRTCLRIPDKLLPLFDDLQLPLKIATISAIEVCPSDNLPSKICEECIKNINLTFNFRKVIRNSDLELRERFAALNNTQIYNIDLSESQIVAEEVKFESSDNEISIEIEENGYDTTEIIEENGYDTTEVIEEDGYDTTEVIELNGYDTTNEIIEDTIVNEEPVEQVKPNPKKKYSFKNMLMYWKRTYECKPCNFSCTELSKWHNHKRTKHYARGICSICGKSMRTDNLHKHIKSHAESPVTCTECGKVFKNSESLRSHSFIHNGPELICKLCGKCYRYRGEYNRHIKRHSLNGVKTVKCPICDKMFHEKKHIKKHMQTHTGERPYLCQYCNKGFSSGYALKTHIRQHTNEKPFICEYCPMAFPQKVSLMTHIKSKHSSPDIKLDNIL